MSLIVALKMLNTKRIRELCWSHSMLETCAHEGENVLGDCGSVCQMSRKLSSKCRRQVCNDSGIPAFECNSVFFRARIHTGRASIAISNDPKCA